MQNNKNKAVLEIGNDNTHPPANRYSNGASNHSSSILKSTSAPRTTFFFFCSFQSITKESVVSNRPTGLSSLFKQLLLDENLRENYFKRAGENRLYNKSSSFHTPAPLSFAEQLLEELSQ